MAKLELPENLKDDILNETMGGKRRYLITRNEDGSFCIEDVSVYDQIGDVFGQARVNAMCRAINESVDHAKIIESVDDLAAITEEGYVVGGKAGAQIINNLGGYSFGETADGEPGYRKPGADTVIPFSRLITQSNPIKASLGWGYSACVPVVIGASKIKVHIDKTQIVAAGRAGIKISADGAVVATYELVNGNTYTVPLSGHSQIEISLSTYGGAYDGIAAAYMNISAWYER